MQDEPKHKPIHFARSAFPRKSAGLLALMGGLVFATGALIHAVDGGHRTAWLLPDFLPGLADTPPVFGSAGRWLPNFAQAFAFCIWTALLPTRSGALASCVLWAVVGIAFELSPLPTSGRDVLGVLATLGGSAAAFWILSYSRTRTARRGTLPGPH